MAKICTFPEALNSMNGKNTAILDLAEAGQVSGK